MTLSRFSVPSPWNHQNYKLHDHERLTKPTLDSKRKLQRVLSVTWPADRELQLVWARPFHNPHFITRKLRTQAARASIYRIFNNRAACDGSPAAMVKSSLKKLWRVNLFIIQRCAAKRAFFPLSPEGYCLLSWLNAPTEIRFSRECVAAACPRAHKERPESMGKVAG